MEHQKGSVSEDFSRTTKQATPDPIPTGAREDLAQIPGELRVRRPAWTVGHRPGDTFPSETPVGPGSTLH